MKRRLAIVVVAISTLASQPVAATCCADESTEPTRTGEPAVNRVLSLNGSSGYLQVDDAQSLHSFTGAITIEVLLKASSFYRGNGNVNSLIRKNVAQTERVSFCVFGQSTASRRWK
jgi:hypothetical protein